MAELVSDIALSNLSLSPTTTDGLIYINKESLMYYDEQDMRWYIRNEFLNGTPTPTPTSDVVFEMRQAGEVSELWIKNIVKVSGFDLTLNGPYDYSVSDNTFAGSLLLNGLTISTNGKESGKLIVYGSTSLAFGPYNEFTKVLVIKTNVEISEIVSVADSLGASLTSDRFSIN